MEGPIRKIGPNKLSTAPHIEVFVSIMLVINIYSPLKVPLTKITAIILVLMIISFNTTGCDNYGKLQRDKELTQAFEKHTLPIDFTYYYYGRDNMPYAVIGLGSEYTLKTELWKAVDFQTDRFKKMVEWIWTDHNYAPYGAYMLGPGGKKVGIWYSSINHATVDVNETQKTIVVIPDKPFLRGDPAK